MQTAKYDRLTAKKNEICMQKKNLHAKKKKRVVRNHSNGVCSEKF
jgi:hypothetical protein